MRYLLTLPALALLVSCGDSSTRESYATYTCPNGPELAVVSSEEVAKIYLPGGRIEELPATDRKGVYARPGVVWDATAFRTARLTEGEKSYQCDQMAG